MDVLEQLRKLTSHPAVKLTPRCNTALLCALYVVKRMNNKPYIFIPDQGGWITYKTLPVVFGFEIKEVPTKHGILDLNYLKENVEKCAALIVKQPAGYFAAQPMQEIYEIMKDKSMLIMDVSGSLGDPELANGDYCDMMVGSFGPWKPINIGYGGFISARDKEMFKIADYIFPICKVSPMLQKDLAEHLKTLKERYEYLYDLNKKVKEELSQYNIVHRHRRGINVLVRYQDEKQKEELIEYCKKNKYSYLPCPRYTRLNEEVISIEIKRCNREATGKYG